MAPCRRPAARPVDAPPRTRWCAHGEWESWTELPFPASGDYVFPEGLAPLRVDLPADLATYWEPNVWMVHPDIDS